MQAVVLPGGGWARASNGAAGRANVRLCLAFGLLCFERR